MLARGDQRVLLVLGLWGTRPVYPLPPLPRRGAPRELVGGPPPSSSGSLESLLRTLQRSDLKLLVAVGGFATFATLSCESSWSPESRLGGESPTLAREELMPGGAVIARDRGHQDRVSGPQTCLVGQSRHRTPASQLHPGVVLRQHWRLTASRLLHLDHCGPSSSRRLRRPRP